MDPIRIALLKNGFDAIDGSAEHLVNYAVQLKAARQLPFVIYANPADPENQYLRYLRENGIEARYLGRDRAVRGYRLRRLVARVVGRVDEFGSWSNVLQAGLADLLRRLRIDVVHTFVDPAAPLALRAATISGIPAICQELLSPRASPESHGYYDELASLLPLCSSVAAQSPRLAQECRERIPYSGHVDIIPNIVDDPGDVVPTPSGRDCVLVGFASRFETRKGPEILVEAFARALVPEPRLRLRMAGEGPLRDRVIARVAQLGIADRCDFPGPYQGRSARRAFFRSIDIFVQPSLAEGIPNSVIEAMANGRAIVTTDVGGIADVLTDDEALLVPPGDPCRLGAALVHLAQQQDLRDSLGRGARALYCDRFSPAAVVPILLNVYRRVVASRRVSTPSPPSSPTGCHPGKTEM